MYLKHDCDDYVRVTITSQPTKPFFKTRTSASAQGNIFLYKCFQLCQKVSTILEQCYWDLLKFTSLDLTAVKIVHAKIFQHLFFLRLLPL